MSNNIAFPSKGGSLPQQPLKTKIPKLFLFLKAELSHPDFIDSPILRPHSMKKCRVMTPHLVHPASCGSPL